MKAPIPQGLTGSPNYFGLLNNLMTLITSACSSHGQTLSRILESEAHPCKYFLEKQVDHGHNLRSCKTNPAHLRIPVSCTVRHKQSFITQAVRPGFSFRLSFFFRVQ